MKRIKQLHAASDQRDMVCKYSYFPYTDLVNDQDEHGNTALHFAVQSDFGKKNMDQELSTKLIEHGAGMLHHLTKYCNSKTRQKPCL